MHRTQSVWVLFMLSIRHVLLVGFWRQGARISPPVLSKHYWRGRNFLGQSQLFIFFQDGIHLCTKIRNRLLPKYVQLKMGLYEVSIKHLYDLMKNTNKIDHNLSKSDLNIHNRQNFSSYQRISSDNVLNLLVVKDQWKATHNYM